MAGRFSAVTALLMGSSAAAAAAAEEPQAQANELELSPEMAAAAAAEIRPLLAKAEQTGFAKANERIAAVFANEAAVAQPKLAARLLKTDMTAEDIVAMCVETRAETKPAEAPSQQQAQGNSQAAEIRASLEGKPRVDPNANGGGQSAEQQDTVAPVALWDGVQGTQNGKPITTGGMNGFGR